MARELTCGSARKATSTAGSRPVPAVHRRRVTAGSRPAKGWLKSSYHRRHRQELKAETATTRKRLSPAQLKTVEQWTSGKGMVRRIQTGNVSAATADAFDQAMHEAPKVDGLVYRGVTPGSELAKLAERMRPGATLRLDEPVSTSIDPEQASSFGTYMFEIDSPAASYVSGIGSKFAYEQEAVLAPGHFKVASVETVKMHFHGHGVYPVRVIKLQDVSRGDRSWRNVDRARLKTGEDRSDRFMQGDDPGEFYVVPSGQRAMPPARDPGWPDFATLVARTAETPVASTVHEPFGSPAGPGLFGTTRGCSSAAQSAMWQQDATGHGSRSAPRRRDSRSHHGGKALPRREAAPARKAQAVARRSSTSNCAKTLEHEQHQANLQAAAAKKTAASAKPAAHHEQAGEPGAQRRGAQGREAPKPLHEAHLGPQRRSPTAGTRAGPGRAGSWKDAAWRLSTGHATVDQRPARWRVRVHRARWQQGQQREDGAPCRCGTSPFMTRRTPTMRQRGSHKARSSARRRYPR